MVEDHHAIGSTPSLDADEIVARSFTRARRGFDTDEVRAHLISVAERVRSLQAHVAELERRVRIAEAAAAKAAPSELDVHDVARLLGEETARVLETAREAAQEIRAKANEERERTERDTATEAERTRAEAVSYAERMRGDADEAAAAARTGAETFATELRRSTEQAAAALRSKAESDAAELRTTSSAQADRSRADADEYAARVRGEADDEVRTHREAAVAAAAATRDEAAADAAKTRSDADEYATRVRGEADQLLATRSEEAEAEAARIAQTAELECEELRSQTARELDAAREQGRELLDEAQRAREVVLGDLAVKRRSARTQLEQLHAARERILAAYEQVREGVDAATSELHTMVPAAKRAADEAVRRAEARPEQTIAELEAELAGDPAILSATREVAAASGAAAGSPDVETVSALSEIGSRGPDEENETFAEPADTASSVLPAPPPEPLSVSVEDASPPAEADAPTTSGAPVASPAERGRSRRRRRGERGATGGLGELDTGELPAVGPSAEFEEVRLLAPSPSPTPSPSPATAPEELPSPEVPDVSDEAEAVDDVDDLFARLRASRSDGDAATDGPAGDGPAGDGPATDGSATDGSATDGSATDGSATDGSASYEAEGGGDVAEVDEALAAGGAPPAEEAATTAEDAVPPPGDVEPVLEELERRDLVLGPIEGSLTKSLKRVLSDEQSRILDGLRTAKGSPSLDALAGDVGEHRGRFEAAATGPLGDAWRAGERFAAGQDPAAAPTGTEPEVAGHAAGLAEGLVDALRGRLGRCFAEDSDAVATGDVAAEHELADRVRACYREWRSDRLAALVADAVLAAFSAGQFASLPEGCSLHWCIDPSAGPCPDAEDNALAGAVVKGSPFPTGHRCPPAHPGCRCLLAPHHP